MNLKEYAKKRNFDKTPEPKPSQPGSGNEGRKGLLYVIQRHQARRLHWDLRLEEDGALKSWAIPKEPPAEAGIRRLAVAVEDHTIEYADFEGTILEGEYGGGTVEIWDKGTYLPLETDRGKRVFEIRGRKLKGKFCLVKIEVRDPKEKNWLFFKVKDKKA